MNLTDRPASNVVDHLRAPRLKPLPHELLFRLAHASALRCLFLAKFFAYCFPVQFSRCESKVRSPGAFASEPDPSKRCRDEDFELSVRFDCVGLSPTQVSVLWTDLPAVLCSFRLFLTLVRFPLRFLLSSPLPSPSRSTLESELISQLMSP